MKRSLAYYSLLMAVALWVILPACDHKEIVWPDGTPHQVELRFMWDNYPEADPEGMTVYFFPLDGNSRIWRFDITGKDGGPVAIPAGRYSMLAYNNDLTGETESNLSEVTQATASAVDHNAIIQGTGPLYAGVISRVDVTPCGVNYVTETDEVKECPCSLLRCHPTPRFCTYNVEVRDLEGADMIRKSSVTLQSVAGAVRLSTGELLPPEMSLDVALGRASSTLSGASTAFGVLPSTEKIVARLNVTRNDGVILHKHYDVTRQVLDAPDPRNVTVVIDSVSIPSPDQPPFPGDDPDVGITVGVDGWYVINIDILT